MLMGMLKIYLRPDKYLVISQSTKVSELQLFFFLLTHFPPWGLDLVASLHFANEGRWGFSKSALVWRSFAGSSRPGFTKRGVCACVHACVSAFVMGGGGGGGTGEGGRKMWVTKLPSRGAFLQCI